MTDPSKQPQNRLMLAYLRARGSEGLSARDAFAHLGIYRAGARVWDLKQAGHRIKTIRHRNRTAVYVLEETA